MLNDYQKKKKSCESYRIQGYCQIFKHIVLLLVDLIVLLLFVKLAVSVLFIQ